MLGKKRVRVADQEDIARVVAEVLEAEGPLAVTVERLALALNVPASDLEVDVDALVAEAYRGLNVAELAEVRRTVLANPSPVEQMRVLLNWMATPPVDSDAIRIEAGALTGRNARLRAAVQDGEAAWHTLIASVIRRGARHGLFLQADAEDVAAHVISLIDAINAYQLTGYRSEVDRMQQLKRVVQAELGLAWGPDLADALP